MLVWLCTLALAGPTERAAALDRELPDAFTVLVEGPWVVVGDENPDVVEGRARTTIRWATETLRQSYFAAPPDDTWTIWLFKDADSYRRHALQLWNDEPPTPYGYAAHDDLVMNIATGSGTLVHEMVHPLMDTNFPDAPVWFEEGLASLYEQSTDRQGHIVGLTNWRLPGLQDALRSDRTVPLTTLVALDRDGFYEGDNSGLHYAQSRYLFLWLQSRGLLGTYYRALWHAQDDDPTGLATLLTVTGIDDPGRLQRRWKRWVMRLTYP